MSSGMFSVSQPCKCDLESISCSGSQRTETNARHTLLHGLGVPQDDRTTRSPRTNASNNVVRPKWQDTRMKNEEGSCAAGRHPSTFILHPYHRDGTMIELGISINGVCDPRFGAVHEEFERNFASRGEVGAAVCVYEGGRKVVDLWGAHKDLARTLPWAEDTIVIMN